MSNVFELNKPDVSRGSAARRGHSRNAVAFAGDVTRIPEFVVPDEKRTPGRPHAARDMKRAIVKARELLEEGTLCVACPAGQLVNSGLTPAVRCGVERSLVTLKDSPTSLISYCTRAATEPGGGYSSCPSWREEKARRIAAPLVGVNEGE